MIKYRLNYTKKGKNIYNKIIKKKSTEDTDRIYTKWNEWKDDKEKKNVINTHTHKKKNIKNNDRKYDN